MRGLPASFRRQVSFGREAIGREADDIVVYDDDPEGGQVVVHSDLETLVVAEELPKLINGLFRDVAFPQFVEALIAVAVGIYDQEADIAVDGVEPGQELLEFTENGSFRDPLGREHTHKIKARAGATNTGHGRQVGAFETQRGRDGYAEGCAQIQKGRMFGAMRSVERLASYVMRRRRGTRHPKRISAAVPKPLHDCLQRRRRMAVVKLADCRPSRCNLDLIAQRIVSEQQESPDEVVGFVCTDPPFQFLDGVADLLMVLRA